MRMKENAISKIQVCNLEDIEQYTDHCIEHMREKGIGNIYVHPFLSTHPWNKEEFLASLTKKWTLPQYSPNWEIAWVAVVNNQFVGHLNLRCGGIEASKHRMRLGMGIITPYRSMGLGKELLDTAIKWAKAQEAVSWIELSVFAKNSTARKLYASFGFQEQWVIKDAIRLEDEIIDDVQMTLKL